MPIVTHPDAVFLGMDVHKDSISVGILNPGHERPDVEKIFHDEESIRRLVDRFPDRSLLWSCYEAGPTGYDLARLLKSLGVRCEVIAPSMIPKAPGDKVKTDTRDCRRLVRRLSDQEGRKLQRLVRRGEGQGEDQRRPLPSGGDEAFIVETATTRPGPALHPLVVRALESPMAIVENSQTR